MDFTPTSEHDLIRQTVRATERSVDPLGRLRRTGGGRRPPHLAPRAVAFGPRDPRMARAGALADVVVGPPAGVAGPPVWLEAA